MVGVSLAVGLLNADVLYWQVDPVQGSVLNGDGMSGETYSAARLMAYLGTDSNIENPTQIGSHVELSDIYSDGTAVTGIQLGDLGDYGDSSYSFYIELGNYANNVFTGTDRSEYKSYNQLLDSGYISLGAPNITPTIGWSGGTYKAVPEPTSGLLLVIGGALLALRRRRQI